MVRADKSFGQHFLVNDAVVARIADQVERLALAESNRSVVEIGPGPGALTGALLSRGLRVVAVEIDRRMIEELQRRFAAELAADRLVLVSGDALEIARAEIEAALPGEAGYVVCGNLPYNVGTPIVFRFLESFPRARAFCYMLQKEVVKKLLAEEGNGDYGPPSVKMRLATETIGHFWVSPGSFRPPPKVDSGVFACRRRATPEADPLERGGVYDRLTVLLNRCFTQRRKMLRNSFPECADSEWAERRPETLPPKDFLEMLSRYVLAAILVIFGLAMPSTSASPWEEQYVGFDRGALQDSLPTLDSSVSPERGYRSADLFQATVNPAFALSQGGSGLALTYLQPRLGNRVDEASYAAGLALGTQQVFRDFVFGAYLTAPWGNSSALDSGSGELRQDPWSLRARQLHFLTSFAWRVPSTGWTLGASVALAYGVKSEVELSIDPANPTTRLRAGFEPRPSFSLGGAWKSGDGRWSLGFAYRERSKAEATVSLVGQLNLATIPISLDASGTAAYLFEPRRIAVQLARRVGETLWIGVGARFTDWSEMPSPLLALDWRAPDLESQPVSFRAKNTWDVSVGTAAALGAGIRAAASYRFAQAAFEDIPFYFDREQHVLGLGLGWSSRETPEYNYFLATRIHGVRGGGLYSWAGVGLGYAL